MRARKLKLEVELKPPAQACRRRSRRGKPECDRALFLEFARSLAMRCALRDKNRLCTADDVAEELSQHGHEESALGRAAGSVFRRQGWRLTRLRVRSRRAANHGRELKVWCLTMDACGRPKSAPPHYALIVHDHRNLPRTSQRTLFADGNVPGDRACRRNGNGNGNGNRACRRNGNGNAEAGEEPCTQS